MLGLPATVAGYAIPSSNLALGPIYGVTQPADLRQVNIDTKPQYDAEETIFMLNLKHDFETFSVKINGGWGNSKVSSRQDFDAGVGPTLAADVSRGDPTLVPLVGRSTATS